MTEQISGYNLQSDIVLCRVFGTLDSGERQEPFSGLGYIFQPLISKEGL